MPACAAGRTSRSARPTSSTSTRWRWSSRSARPRVHPRLAIELAAELAGTRGAEAMTAGRDRARPRRRVRGRPAQDPGPDGHQRRRVVHRRRAHRRRRSRRRGRRALLPDRGRPGPAGRRWPTSPSARSGARDAALAIPEPAAGREPRLPDPGFARFRADGEAHLFSPRIAGEIQVLSGHRRDRRRRRAGVDDALARYRAALARPATERSVPRDELRVRGRARRPIPLATVEDARVDRPPVRRLAR